MVLLNRDLRPDYKLEQIRMGDKIPEDSIFRAIVERTEAIGSNFRGDPMFGAVVYGIYEVPIDSPATCECHGVPKAQCGAKGPPEK